MFPKEHTISIAGPINQFVDNLVEQHVKQDLDSFQQGLIEAVSVNNDSERPITRISH